MLNRMQLVEVVPIAAGGKEPLSYFAASSISLGDIVSVPLRKKNVNALVVGVTELKSVKADVKRIGYRLKKISRVKTSQFFSPPFIKAANLAADYFAASLGETLRLLTPPILFELGAAEAVSLTEPPRKGGVKPEKLCVQDTDEDRLSFYKSLIRGEFAKGASVFVALPTVTDLERVAFSLGRGIERYAFVFHRQLTKRKLLTNWRQLNDCRHPLVIIATPAFLSLPRRDIKTIIVDRESSEIYKSPRRPFVDFRKFAEIFAQTSGAKLILGDVSLRVETICRLENKEFSPAAKFRFRLTGGAAESELIAIRGPEILSEEVKFLIAAGREKRERTVILVGRRGLAPSVICKDCGEAVRCLKCGWPATLHQPSEGEKTLNILFCHKCLEQRSAAEKCRFCQSWRLTALGIGIEKIENELRNALPGLTLFRLDSDTVKTHRRAEEVVKRFLAAASGVLLGSEMILFYLRNRVENGLALGIDSLLSLPDFRINEKVFNLLTRLRLLAVKRFIIQTRLPGLALYANVLSGNLSEFYRLELADRRLFGYPPYKTLIKISRVGLKRKVEEEMKRLAQMLADWQPILSPSFFPDRRGRCRLNLVLKLEPKIDTAPLFSLLKKLPPSFAVEVDPENVL